MTTMVAELYDALREAGASEDKARKAAETAANHDTRFVGADAKLDKLAADVNVRFAKVEGELALLRWMTGANIAICISLLMLALRH